MILLETCFSPVIYKTYRPIVFSKGIAVAWTKICEKYRPASSQEGLHVISRQWTALQKEKDESLEEFIARLDTLALAFDGYRHPKDDEKKIEAVINGLLRDPD